MRSVIHWRALSRGVAAVLLSASLLTACGGDAATRQNIRPPKPGTPAAASEVQGIYRSIRQGLLQLRGDGEFVLIVPEQEAASAGTYTLNRGDLTVRTDDCGPALGEYRLDVGGRQVAGKATLFFTAVADECAARRRALTSDPWVYADS